MPQKFRVEQQKIHNATLQHGHLGPSLPINYNYKEEIDGTNKKGDVDYVLCVLSNLQCNFTLK